MELEKIIKLILRVRICDEEWPYPRSDNTEITLKKFNDTKSARDMLNSLKDEKVLYSYLEKEFPNLYKNDIDRITFNSLFIEITTIEIRKEFKF